MRLKCHDRPPPCLAPSLRPLALPLSLIFSRTKVDSLLVDGPENCDMAQELSEAYDDRTPGPTNQRSNALANKLSSVLSVSYADSEIRDALHFLDSNNTENTPDLRRKLRWDLQKEVIRCNGSIVKDFGQVAEVGRRRHVSGRVC